MSRVVFFGSPEQIPVINFVNFYYQTVFGVYTPVMPVLTLPSDRSVSFVPGG